METRPTWSPYILVLLFTLGTAEVTNNVEHQTPADDKSRTGAYVHSSEETELYLVSPNHGQPSYLPSVQTGYSHLLQPNYNPSIQPGYLPSLQPSYQQQQETEYMVEYKVQEKPSVSQSHYVQPSYVPAVQQSYVPSVQPSYIPSVQPNYVPSVQPHIPVTESELLLELLEEAQQNIKQQDHSHLHQNYGSLIQPNYVPSLQPNLIQSSYSTGTESEFVQELLEEQQQKHYEYGQYMQPTFNPSVQHNYGPTNKPSYLSDSELIHEYIEGQQQHLHVTPPVHTNIGTLIQPAHVQPSYYLPSVQPGHISTVSESELIQEVIEGQHHHHNQVNPGYIQSEQVYAQSSYNIVPGKNIYSRLIPIQEYILPHKEPGAENSVKCQREGELHNFWSPNYECLVCTCVREGYALEPVCVSCSGCALPPSPPPPPVPEPIVIPIPTPQPELIPIPVPTPMPEPVQDVVTCSPMPSGTPFQNPLNPCQVCICFESVNVYGQPDVKIECQENPQCVVPDVVPMLPDTPQPVPLPMCRQFPTNVLFPHPREMCKLCKCTVQTNPLGTQQDVIDCFPDPQCPTPTPVVPVPTPQPEIIIIPEVVVIEPEQNAMPEQIRPPAPTPTPVGPLPGPSPHESCRPFAPNQLFQHPWDECQVCVCSEAYNVGRISIEVNCYTKKSCCIELPFETTTLTTLQPLSVPGPNITPYGSMYPLYKPQEPEVVPIPKHIIPYQYPLGSAPHNIPGQLVPGQYTTGQLIPGEVLSGPSNPGHYTPGQYTPGHIIPGEVHLTPGHITTNEMLSSTGIAGHTPKLMPGSLISGEILPGHIYSGQHGHGQVRPSPGYSGGGSWSVTSDAEYQETDIVTSTGYNQLPGNQGNSYQPVWKGINGFNVMNQKGIPGLGTHLNQRPSHMYTSYGYDVNTGGGSYTPSHYTGEEGYYSSTGPTGNQQGHLSGQLLSSQGVVSNNPYTTGYNPMMSNQGYTAFTKKIKLKSGDPDSTSSEESK